MTTAWSDWRRAIILVDMNAFFASIEQQDNPRWRGRPVAVTNGTQGSCIITCSYEARAFGIKTGMRLREARRLCADLIQAPSRPARYAAVSTKIMQALAQVTPDQEIFSVDECFLDVSRCRTLYETPQQAAEKAKACVHEASGLLCSVGLSGDKTTAKYAAKQQKPNGFTVIPPHTAADVLSCVPVDELCGIGPGIARFLAQHGVHCCGDMSRLPISILARRFGNLGRRLWYMCQGCDPDPVHQSVADPKSIGHGKVLPPGCADKAVILSFMYRMSLKVAARLRDHQLSAKKFFIGFKSVDWGWLGGHFYLPTADQDGHAIFQLVQQCYAQYQQHHGVVRQVQVTALRPEPMHAQGDLFASYDAQQQQLNQVMDDINQRFGNASLQPLSILQHQSTVDVIAPAWRPDGVRNSIKRSKG
jgi:DNA polymerase-4